MVMEKPSPLLVRREFVRQYYTLLNQAPDILHRFYGKNSSYAHRGLDSNGKPADAVYGQKEIHRKVMSQNFTNCHTKIRHVDAHATLNDGVVVQVMGLLSNNNQALRRFMKNFVLAPEGSVANTFYVHNDIFRYQDEVFGGFVTEPQEGKCESVFMVTCVASDCLERSLVTLYFMNQQCEGSTGILLLGRDTMTKATHKGKHFIGGWLTLSQV